MTTQLRDVTGFRGEKIIELCLTDYAAFPAPLFRPGFLGDKWPAIDFYVELTGVSNRRPYFFVQVKTSTAKIRRGTTNLTISSTRRDVSRLLQVPGPTYILGVHEPSKRVFARAVHADSPVKAITRIPLAYELTSANSRMLHQEVREFWQTSDHKPTESVFA